MSLPPEKKKELEEMKKMQQNEPHDQRAARCDKEESAFDPSAVPSRVRDRVLTQFRSILGGREYFVITGGAPTSESVKKFISDCFGGLFSEDYGTTEVNVIREIVVSLNFFIRS